MLQKLPVNNFKWVKDISEFDKIFIKSYNENIDKICVLEFDVQYPENLHSFHNDLFYLPEKVKTEQFEKLEANLRKKGRY